MSYLFQFSFITSVRMVWVGCSGAATHRPFSLCQRVWQTNSSGAFYIGLVNIGVHRRRSKDGGGGTKHVPTPTPQNLVI